MKKFDPEETIEAVWCVDNRTGYRYLIDLRTNKLLAKWTKEHKHDYQYCPEYSDGTEDFYRCECGALVWEPNDLGSGA